MGHVLLYRPTRVIVRIKIAVSNTMRATTAGTISFDLFDDSSALQPASFTALQLTNVNQMIAVVRTPFGLKVCIYSPHYIDTNYIQVSVMSSFLDACESLTVNGTIFKPYKCSNDPIRNLYS